jgi:hypothetical protein
MMFNRAILTAALGLSLLLPSAARDQKAAKRQQVEQLAASLNLTPEQKDKLAPILREEAGKLKAVRDDQSLSKPDRRAKLQSIQKETQERVRPILTEEQNKKWEEARAQARAANAKKAK